MRATSALAAARSVNPNRAATSLDRRRFGGIEDPQRSASRRISSSARYSYTHYDQPPMRPAVPERTCVFTCANCQLMAEGSSALDGAVEPSAGVSTGRSLISQQSGPWLGSAGSSSSSAGRLPRVNFEPEKLPVEEDVEKDFSHVRCDPANVRIPAWAQSVGAAGCRSPLAASRSRSAAKQPRGWHKSWPSGTSYAIQELIGDHECRSRPSGLPDGRER
jgi:hypothetical protein